MPSLNTKLKTNVFFPSKWNKRGTESLTVSCLDIPRAYMSTPAAPTGHCCLANKTNGVKVNKAKPQLERQQVQRCSLDPGSCASVKLSEVNTWAKEHFFMDSKSPQVLSGLCRKPQLSEHSPSLSGQERLEPPLTPPPLAASSL